MASFDARRPAFPCRKSRHRQPAAHDTERRTSWLYLLPCSRREAKEDESEEMLARDLPSSMVAAPKEYVPLDAFDHMRRTPREERLPQQRAIFFEAESTK